MEEISNIWSGVYLASKVYLLFRRPPNIPHIMVIIIKALSPGGRQDNGDGEQGPTGGPKFILKNI